jgi:hypothetical protein
VIYQSYGSFAADIRPQIEDTARGVDLRLERISVALSATAPARA